jgi:ferritin-like metal-binding protein YciE
VAHTIEQQLSMYLQDAHAIELQALEQVRRAPKIAGDAEIAKAFEEHVGETEQHRRSVQDRLTARAWRPVLHKDMTARVTGVGMALFARLQPDTPGKLVAHAFSYEHMELAAYDLLARLADSAGDGDTMLAARTIERDERAMAERLAGCFDRAVEASLRESEPDSAAKQLDKYLADAHAIEQQALKLLEKAPKLVGPAAPLAQAFEEHLAQTRHHSELIDSRLAARGASGSSLKDAALRLGALNLGMFMKVQADTPAKLAGFAYAFEHLEIAAYELLKRLATRVDDAETVAAADEILEQERAAAANIQGLFGDALEASLQESGVRQRTAPSV